MGSRNSAPAVRPTGALRTFYLVVGEPSIHYVKERTQGPLIYDVAVEKRAIDKEVEHTQTYQLSGAVPFKQDFTLTQCSSRGGGYELSFGIALSQPVKRLCVYAGMDIRYIKGKGVGLVQSEKGHKPCRVLIMECVPTSQAEETDGELLSSGRLLTSAPLVIALELEPHEQNPSDTTNHHDIAAESTNKETVHYTFLDIPTEAFTDKSSDAASPTERKTKAKSKHSIRNGLPATIKARVVKQLLQVGEQVYELENVFDLGVADDIGSDSDDGNLCVVCLTNNKDTTILPCRHMCLCYECAAQLRFSNNKCPICRGNIARVMTI